MSAQDFTVLQALSDARTAIRAMLKEGLAEAKYVYGLTCLLAKKHGLSEDDSLIIVEAAFHLINKDAA